MSKKYSGCRFAYTVKDNVTGDIYDCETVGDLEDCLRDITPEDAPGYELIDDVAHMANDNYFVDLESALGVTITANRGRRGAAGKKLRRASSASWELVYSDSRFGSSYKKEIDDSGSTIVVFLDEAVGGYVVAESEDGGKTHGYYLSPDGEFDAAPWGNKVLAFGTAEEAMEFADSNARHSMRRNSKGGNFMKNKGIRRHAGRSQLYIDWIVASVLDKAPFRSQSDLSAAIDDAINHYVRTDREVREVAEDFVPEDLIPAGGLEGMTADEMWDAFIDGFADTVQDTLESYGTRLVARRSGAFGGRKRRMAGMYDIPGGAIETYQDGGRWYARAFQYGEYATGRCYGRSEEEAVNKCKEELSRWGFDVAGRRARRNAPRRASRRQLKGTMGWRAPMDADGDAKLEEMAFKAFGEQKRSANNMHVKRNRMTGGKSARRVKRAQTVWNEYPVKLPRDKSQWENYGSTIDTTDTKTVKNVYRYVDGNGIEYTVEEELMNGGMWSDDVRYRANSSIWEVRGGGRSFEGCVMDIENEMNDYIGSQLKFSRRASMRRRATGSPDEMGGGTNVVEPLREDFDELSDDLSTDKPLNGGADADNADYQPDKARERAMEVRMRRRAMRRRAATANELLQRAIEKVYEGAPYDTLEDANEAINDAATDSVLTMDDAFELLSYYVTDDIAITDMFWDDFIQDIANSVDPGSLVGDNYIRLSKKANNRRDSNMYVKRSAGKNRTSMRKCAATASELLSRAVDRVNRGAPYDSDEEVFEAARDAAMDVAISYDDIFELVKYYCTDENRIFDLFFDAFEFDIEQALDVDELTGAGRWKEGGRARKAKPTRQSFRKRAQEADEDEDGDLPEFLEEGDEEEPEDEDEDEEPAEEPEEDREARRAAVRKAMKAARGKVQKGARRVDEPEKNKPQMRQPVRVQRRSANVAGKPAATYDDTCLFM